MGMSWKGRGTAYKRNNKLVGCKLHNDYLYAIISHAYYSPIDIQYLMAKNSFLGNTVKNAKGYWKFCFPFFISHFFFVFVKCSLPKTSILEPLWSSLEKSPFYLSEIFVVFFFLLIAWLPLSLGFWPCVLEANLCLYNCSHIFLAITFLFLFFFFFSGKSHPLLHFFFISCPKKFLFLAGSFYSNPRR